MIILSVESTCDETAVAVVEDGRKVLSDAILSQADMHALYGGVVPEIASRKHIEAMLKGVNEDGIMVSSHVLYNDWNFKGSGKKNVPLTKIPFIILSKLHSIDDISMLQEYLDNIQVNNYLKNAEYLMQYLVTDGTTSYVISPSENGYEIIDISELPQLANFKWLNKAEIDLSDPDLQLRPTGVERWNLIASNPTLEDLRFTKAYESDDRLSEFIGINHTTKESSEDDLRVIYQKAHNIYVDRERDGKTWQTVHSVVYSSAGIEELYTQENYRYKVI